MAHRYFNTSGPNRPYEHYTLYRPTLLKRGIQLVKNERYFTIWAPRQTGKSTYFRVLADELKKEGYKACYINFENYFNASQKDFLDYFYYYLKEDWEEDFYGLSIEAIFKKIATIKEGNYLLIIDEVEGINPVYFNLLLHSMRNVYHTRTSHALKSIILVGVSNITGVVSDNASPFNVSDSLHINYFTKEEVFELLGQHETETGQLFEKTVKEKIYSITAGQPGLVNGFALELVERNPTKPIIDYLDYLKIEDWYLYQALDKNVANIVNKAKKYQSFIEKLLFLEQKVRFDIDKEEIRFLYVNGVIKSDEQGYISFEVPLYKKRLQKYFYPIMNGESALIQGDILLDNYLTKEKEFDWNKMIRNYQSYAQKRGFRYFIEYDAEGNPTTLKEAALVYSFETYIQSFLQVLEGKSYLEAHLALGRSDLIVNIHNKEFVIEAKIYYNITQFANGKKQLAYYIHSLGLNIGIYLVFVNKEVKNAAVLEGIDIIEGVEIHTYLVKYDLMVDFTEKSKGKKK